MVPPHYLTFEPHSVPWVIDLVEIPCKNASAAQVRAVTGSPLHLDGYWGRI